MTTINNVLKRVYKVLDIKRDSEFCKRYNLRSSTISTWKKRGTIPYELIVEISQKENISLDYLLKGSQNESSFIEVEKLKSENSALKKNNTYTIVR